MQSDLNQYAGTIAAVFEQLTVLYKEDVSSGDWDETACSLSQILDADTCAEIIATAKGREENG